MGYNIQEIPLDLVERSSVSTIRTKIKAYEREGCVCPVCEGIVKVYRRKLNSTMARQLINLYHLHRRTTVPWIDILSICQETGVSGGDFAKLLHWGLIEAKPHNAGDEGKKTSGLWRITKAGTEFVLGMLAVHPAVYLLSGQVVGWDGRHPTTIRQCLGDHFDYNELMEAA